MKIMIHVVIFVILIYIKIAIFKDIYSYTELFIIMIMFSLIISNINPIKYFMNNILEMKIGKNRFKFKENKASDEKNRAYFNYISLIDKGESKFNEIEWMKIKSNIIFSAKHDIKVVSNMDIKFWKYLNKKKKKEKYKYLKISMWLFDEAKKDNTNLKLNRIIIKHKTDTHFNKIYKILKKWHLDYDANILVVQDEKLHQEIKNKAFKIIDDKILVIYNLEKGCVKSIKITEDKERISRYNKFYVELLGNQVYDYNSSDKITYS